MTHRCISSANPCPDAIAACRCMRVARTVQLSARHRRRPEGEVAWPGLSGRASLRRQNPSRAVCTVSTLATGAAQHLVRSFCRQVSAPVPNTGGGHQARRTCSPVWHTCMQLPSEVQLRSALWPFGGEWHWARAQSLSWPASGQSGVLRNG